LTLSFAIGNSGVSTVYAQKSLAPTYTHTDAVVSWTYPRSWLALTLELLYSGPEVDPENLPKSLN